MAAVRVDLQPEPSFILVQRLLCAARQRVPGPTKHRFRQEAKTRTERLANSGLNVLLSGNGGCLSGYDVRPLLVSLP